MKEVINFRCQETNSESLSHLQKRAKPVGCGTEICGLNGNRREKCELNLPGGDGDFWIVEQDVAKVKVSVYDL